MSEIRGRLDPETRASLDAVLAKNAAPGMCNPDDQSPCLDGEPSDERAAPTPEPKANATTTPSKPWPNPH